MQLWDIQFTNACMLQISFNQLVYYEYGSEKPVRKPKLTNLKLKLNSGAATGGTELKPKLDSKGAATVGKEAATKLNVKSSTKEAQSASPQVMINTYTNKAHKISFISNMAFVCMHNNKYYCRAKVICQ